MSLHEKQMRDVYADTLNALIDADENVMCLEADLGKATGTFPSVLKKHPENFIDVGVAEANMIGIGAGLANEGKIPFCASFSCFASRRVYDQVTISGAYANNNIKVVGTSPGVTATYNGGTHMCFQDLGIMRIMPNMNVYSPADVYELVACMKFMAKENHPTYMQLVRETVPKVFDEGVEFDPKKAKKLSDGKDVTIVATGFTTHLAVKAAEMLRAEGITADVLHYGSVKPFDSDSLVASAKKTGKVVTVENQSVLGGLGSAVCEVLSEKQPTKVKRLGAQDRFGEVGPLDYLIKEIGIGADDIVKAVKSM